jgi:hypothetical protein
MTVLQTHHDVGCGLPSVHRPVNLQALVMVALPGEKFDSDDKSFLNMSHIHLGGVCTWDCIYHDHGDFDNSSESEKSLKMTLVIYYPLLPWWSDSKAAFSNKYSITDAA